MIFVQKIEKTFFSKSLTMQQNLRSMFRRPDEPAESLVDPLHSRNLVNFVKRLFLSKMRKVFHPRLLQCIYLRQSRTDDHRMTDFSAELIDAFGKTAS